MNELVNVLLKTRHNKSPGIDNIPAEVWKTVYFNEYLIHFCIE